jgi:hypothetical protein
MAFMWSLVMRGMIVMLIALVAMSAMHHGPYKPLPTSAMPAVDIP